MNNKQRGYITNLIKGTVALLLYIGVVPLLGVIFFGDYIVSPASEVKRYGVFALVWLLAQIPIYLLVWTVYCEWLVYLKLGETDE